MAHGEIFGSGAFFKFILIKQEIRKCIFAVNDLQDYIIHIFILRSKFSYLTDLIYLLTIFLAS